jgi:hypothetical protein
MRAVSMAMTAVALSAAVLSVVYGGAGAGAGAGSLAAARTMELDSCPPPCVPHVFSQQEESELKSMSAGQSAISGNEAVEQAMAAANDANDHMQTIAPPPAPAVQTETAVSPASGLSQWDQMHGISSPAQVAATTAFKPAPRTVAASASPDSAALSSALNILLSHNRDGAHIHARDSRRGDERRERRRGSHDGREDDARSARRVLDDMTRPQLRALASVMLRKMADRGDESRRGELRNMLRDGGRDHDSLRRAERQDEGRGNEGRGEDRRERADRGEHEQDYRRRGDDEGRRRERAARSWEARGASAGAAGRGGLSDGESDKLRHAREAMEQGAANLARAFPIGGSHRAQSAALLQLVESLKGHGARGGAGDRLSQLVELSPKVDSGVARLASVGRENARAELGEKTASQQGGGALGLTKAQSEALYAALLQVAGVRK